MHSVSRSASAQGCRWLTGRILTQLLHCPCVLLSVCFLMRDKKGVDLEGRGSEKVMREIKEEKSVLEYIVCVYFSLSLSFSLWCVLFLNWSYRQVGATWHDCWERGSGPRLSFTELSLQAGVSSRLSVFSCHQGASPCGGRAAHWSKRGVRARRRCLALGELKCCC